MTNLRTPFDSIENAQEYLVLLSEAIRETTEALQSEAPAEADKQSVRVLRAVQLIQYDLQKLASHVNVSCRLLNDLRMLRRVLHAQVGEGIATVRGETRSNLTADAGKSRAVQSPPRGRSDPIWV